MSNWASLAKQDTVELKQRPRAKPGLPYSHALFPTSMTHCLLRCSYQLMALGLALQFLVVVKGESVKDCLLLLIHSSHGALLVDLVDVDGFFPLQDGTPPVLANLAQIHLGQTERKPVSSMAGDSPSLWRKNIEHRGQRLAEDRHTVLGTQQSV